MPGCAHAYMKLCMCNQQTTIMFCPLLACWFSYTWVNSEHVVHVHPLSLQRVNSLHSVCSWEKPNQAFPTPTVQPHVTQRLWDATHNLPQTPAGHKMQIYIHIVCQAPAGSQRHNMQVCVNDMSSPARPPDADTTSTVLPKKGWPSTLRAILTEEDSKTSLAA